MPDANEIRQTQGRYMELMTKGDVDAIVALYADDATIEDPIGSEVRAGRGAIRAFYEASAGTVTLRRSGPVRVAGSEAATPMVVLMGPPGQQQALPVISVMKFDDSGRIASMRAFWSFDDLRPATADDLG